MNSFSLTSPFQPMGDQPKAIEQLVAGLENEHARQAPRELAKRSPLLMSSSKPNVLRLFWPTTKRLLLNCSKSSSNFFPTMPLPTLSATMIIISLKPTYHAATPILKKRPRSTMKLSECGTLLLMPLLRVEMSSSLPAVAPSTRWAILNGMGRRLSSLRWVNRVSVLVCCGVWWTYIMSVTMLI